MPKFELNSYNNGQEISFLPDLGDLRINEFHILERWTGSMWEHLGNIEVLMRDCTNMKIQIVEFETWMYKQNIKDDELQTASEIENDYETLKEMGQHLRQLEKMVRVARKSYKAMSVECIEMQKTFERLDKPYPEKV